jgi:hypothetical protein
MAKLSELSNVALFKDLLKDPDRKSITRIIYELFYLLIIYREIPVHYFSRYLFKKQITNIKDFLPNKFLGNKITPNFNDQKVKEVLDNKLFFDFYYGQFNITLPKILMYNYRKIFVIGKKSIEVNSIQEFRSLLIDLFQQNPSYDSIFIKKTLAGSCGSNIFKLFLHQLSRDAEEIEEIYTQVIKSEFLFQETVKQHHELNRLNSSCLNTIRFDTFINREGVADLISGYIRMSIRNCYIDNISSGGCQVGIDLQTGKLKKLGYTPIKCFGVKVLKEHPVSKITFENFEIPMFSQAKELVLRTAKYMPGLRLVGWDVAIGETGPVLVEGNSDYDITGNDLVDGGYLANTAFRKVLHEINYL